MSTEPWMVDRVPALPSFTSEQRRGAAIDGFVMSPMDPNRGGQNFLAGLSTFFCGPDYGKLDI